jgi:hypothetical protein
MNSPMAENKVQNPNSNNQKIVKPPTARISGVRENLKKLFRFTVVFFVIIIILILTYTVSYFLNLDSRIFKLSFQGKVTNENNLPIKSAVIKFDGRETVTDENGEFKFSDVEEGEVTVEVEAEGYVREEHAVSFQKSFMGYSYAQNFQLESAVVAEISGNFLADENHKFSDDKLFINDKEVEINTKGEFSTSVETGSRVFLFESDKYKDIQQNIEILPGKNFLDDIELIGAGDVIMENKDYVTKQKVTGIKIIATEIETDQINIGDSEIRIKDLELNKEYSIRVTAPNHQERDYKFSLTKKGATTLFDFKLVPEGRISYLTEPEDSRDEFLFESDLDGFNTKQITNTENFVEINNLIYTNDSELYFVSDEIQRINSTMGGRAELLFKFNDDGSNSSLISNTANLGDLYFYPEQKKILNFTNTGSSRSPKFQLELMNLEGTSRNLLIELTNTQVVGLLMSDDGSQIYTKEINGDDQFLLRNIDVSTKQSTILLENQKILNLHSVSSDGNKVVYSALDSSDNFTDLIMRDISRAEKRTLIVNDLGKYYQFVKGSNNDIVFVENSKNRDTFFKYSIEQNRRIELFKLNLNDSVNKLVQKNNLFVYVIEGKGLYLFDVINPFGYVTVVNGTVRI